jgi:hypothetical protein
MDACPLDIYVDLIHNLINHAISRALIFKLVNEMIY